MSSLAWRELVNHLTKKCPDKAAAFPYCPESWSLAVFFRISMVPKQTNAVNDATARQLYRRKSSRWRTPVDRLDRRHLCNELTLIQLIQSPRSNPHASSHAVTSGLCCNDIASSRHFSVLRPSTAETPQPTFGNVKQAGLRNEIAHVAPHL